MDKKMETYAFNFNPRESPKDFKVKYSIRQGVLRRCDITPGTIKQNVKDAYLAYNQCLESSLFDRTICRANESAVIECEHREGLHPTNEEVVNRLKLGLANNQKRREEIDKKLNEKYKQAGGKSENDGSEGKPVKND